MSDALTRQELMLAVRQHDRPPLGIVAPVGRQGVEQLLGIVADPNDKRVPEVARVCIAALGTQLRVLKAQILDRMITRARIP